MGKGGGPMGGKKMSSGKRRGYKGEKKNSPTFSIVEGGLSQRKTWIPRGRWGRQKRMGFLVSEGTKKRGWCRGKRKDLGVKCRTNNRDEEKREGGRGGGGAIIWGKKKKMRKSELNERGGKREGDTSRRREFAGVD